LLLNAALEGIQNHMVPEEEYVGSAYQKQHGKTLPQSLFDAIELAKNSEFVSSIVQATARIFLGGQARRLALVRGCRR